MRPWGALPSPDVASFASVVRGCHLAGQHAAGDDVVRLMAAHGVRPNVTLVILVVVVVVVVH